MKSKLTLMFCSAINKSNKFRKLKYLQNFKFLFSCRLTGLQIEFCFEKFFSISVFLRNELLKKPHYLGKKEPANTNQCTELYYKEQKYRNVRSPFTNLYLYDQKYIKFCTKVKQYSFSIRYL